VVEAKTAELMESATAELDEILALGGAFEALDEVKGRLVRSQSDRRRAIEAGELPVVGVNVYTTSEESPLAGEGSILRRLSLEKQYKGDLKGSSKGQLLAAFTDVATSAAFVALERVSGILDGKIGHFVLMHGMTTQGQTGTATGFLSVAVVPDSGAGQLVGLAGKMRVTRDDQGKYSYDFEYTLPS